jgi:S-adenosylmethionine decarboxylase
MSSGSFCLFFCFQRAENLEKAIPRLGAPGAPGLILNQDRTRKGPSGLGIFMLERRLVIMDGKMKLYGFNNLTKSLSFNIYDVCYAKTQREQKDYISYIDEQYNSDRLTKILTHVTEMIGAKVLNISKQDYEPQGASVTILVAEGSMIPVEGDTVVAHLDKSHVTVHTYPEYHPDTCLATFRVDIDVATCGEITPLSTLDYLIGSFDSDIITMDYRVRGFTRDVAGKKLFMDHKITSIQDYIDTETLQRYDAVDINVYQANLFHTKMLIKEIDLQNYLFNTDVYELPPKTRLAITDSLRKEMIEVFSGSNIY